MSSFVSAALHLTHFIALLCNWGYAPDGHESPVEKPCSCTPHEEWWVCSVTQLSWTLFRWLWVPGDPETGCPGQHWQPWLEHLVDWPRWLSTGEWPRIRLHPWWPSPSTFVFTTVFENEEQNEIVEGAWRNPEATAYGVGAYAFTTELNLASCSHCIDQTYQRPHFSDTKK